jgi:hypothetical protein
MATNLPAALPALTDREAIIDAVIRSVTAVDTNDIDLWKSAFTMDSILDLLGDELHGLDAATKGCFEPLSQLDTTHMVSNFRVNHQPGSMTAEVTAIVVAHHFRQGEGMMPGGEQLTNAASYFAECVRDEGDAQLLWRMQRFVVKGLWRQGNPGVMGSGLSDLHQ